MNTIFYQKHQIEFICSMHNTIVASSKKHTVRVLATVRIYFKISILNLTKNM